jgi:CheY-like chemotaxis protein
MSAVLPLQSSHPSLSSTLRPAAAPRPVLLVEDDPINRMVAEAFLQSLGHQDIRLAGDGQEALVLCGRHDFALVLMDCVMPVMGGLEATRRLRALGLRMPVIALTGSTGEDDIRRCLEAGMDDHLPKPLDLQRLQGTLAHWLALPREHASALN